MKRLLFIGLVLSLISANPASAAKPSTKPKGTTIYTSTGIKVTTFCDKANLVYIMDPQFTGWAKWDGGNPTLFVIPNDAQCKGTKK